MTRSRAAQSRGAWEDDVPLIATEGYYSLTRKHDLAEMVKVDERVLDDP